MEIILAVLFHLELSGENKNPVVSHFMAEDPIVSIGVHPAVNIRDNRRTHAFERSGQKILDDKVAYLTILL